MKINWFKIKIGLLAILVLGAFVSYKMISENKVIQKVGKNTKNEEREIRNNINNWVTISANQYKVNRLEGIRYLTIIVNNETDFLINRITIAIDYFKKEGKLCKVRYVTIKNLSKTQSKSLTIPDCNCGTSIKITTKQIRSKELQLCYDDGEKAEKEELDPNHCK